MTRFSNATGYFPAVIMVGLAIVFTIAVWPWGLILAVPMVGFAYEFSATIRHINRNGLPPEEERP